MYCDVAVPAEWPHPAEVITVDLDLDICRARADGSVFVEDEDEFARHRVRYGYPQNVVVHAKATSRWLSAALSERAEPFGSRYRTWLELT